MYTSINKTKTDHKEIVMHKKSTLISTVSIFCLIVSLFVFVGCKEKKSNEDKSIDQLITHFNKSEINGQRTSKSFAMIGAIDGCGYKSGTISIEIYKFKESDQIASMLPYKNGHFGMLIHKPTTGPVNKKIIDTFHSF